MRVTLHLGAHRTGVSAVWGALMANKSGLREAGLAFWGPDELRSGLGAGLVRRPDRVTLAEEKRGRRAVGRLQLAQAQLAREGTERLLMIAPDWLGQTEHCLSEAQLYPVLGERLLRVLPCLGERCDRVTLSIRRPDRWWASVLAELVALGWPLPTPSELDRLVTHPRRWRHVIHEVAALFPKAKLIVWPCETLIDLPERQVAAMIESDRELLMTPYRARLDRAPCAATLRDMLDHRGIKTPLRSDATGRWTPFDTLQRDTLAAQYKEDLAWLARGADGRATAIGLDGADLAYPAPPTGQQGAPTHDPPPLSRNLV